MLHSLSHVKGGPKWTLGGKNKSRSLSETPGPAHYNSPETPSNKYSKSPTYRFAGSPRSAEVRCTTPSPCNYSPQNPNQVSAKFSFGSSARQDGVRSISPGPGAYSAPTSQGSHGPKFSLRGRGQTPPPKQHPGPGAYTPAKEAVATKSGSYTFSHSDRFMDKKVAGPAPNCYSPNNPNHSSAAFGFGTSQRKGAKVPESPGVAAYNIPSTIGSTAAYTIRSRNGTPPRSNSLPGFGFGTELKSSIHLPCGPGPGAYNSKDELGRGPKFTMNGRPAPKQVVNMPGPGHYSSNHTQFG